MRKNLIAFTLGFLVALVGLHATSTHAGEGEAAPRQQLPPARPVFEYAHVEGTKSKPAKLNDMGAQGWELVTAFQSDAGMVFIFKRLGQN